MTEKKSTVEATKARVGKKSKRHFSKQSLREMPRIHGLLEEIKEDIFGHTKYTISSIR
jgi:hypothetical protein